MLHPGLLPLGVPAGARGIVDAELLGDIVQHLGRHIERIGQEGADEPDGHGLEGEPETVVVTTTAGDQGLVRVIEVEASLQLHSRRRAGVAAVRGGLLITEELNGHERAR